MNVKVLILFLLAILILGIGSQCFAITIPNPIEAETISELIQDIADLVFWVALAIVPFMIIVGGIMFLIAGGDPQKVGRAKSLLFWSGVGLAVLLLAQAIAAVIETIIGGT